MIDNKHDDESDQAIDELNTSIGQRESENSGYPPGDPNGDKEDRANHREEMVHDNRIKDETKLKYNLEGRRQVRDVRKDL